MECLTSFAHSDFLHDSVAFSVIIPFRYLFVVDESVVAIEYDSEEDTDEEKNPP